MAFSMAAICECIPRLQRNQAGLGNMQIGELVERRGGSIVVHANMVENTDRSAARPDGDHVVLQVGNGLLHTGLGIRFDLFDRIKRCGDRRRRFSFHKAKSIEQLTRTVFALYRSYPLKFLKCRCCWLLATQCQV